MEFEPKSAFVQPKCFIENASGLKAVTAAQKRALNGNVCPLVGREYQVPTSERPDTPAYHEEIAKQLPPCECCGLRAQRYDFKFQELYDVCDDITRTQ